MEQILSCEAIRSSVRQDNPRPHFMETVGSLLHSQAPARPPARQLCLS